MSFSGIEAEATIKSTYYSIIELLVAVFFALFSVDYQTQVSLPE